MNPWFKNTYRQIQRLSYEIDHCLSILSHGSSITFDHLIAFNEAVAQRDKLTAQIMRYLAEQIKPQVHNQPETITKPESVPDNVVKLPIRQRSG